MVDGSAGGRDKDRVPPDLARPDPREATAPAIDVSGTIDLPRLREDSRGLWMARQLCDVVSACRAPGAFTVRIISLY